MSVGQQIFLFFYAIVYGAFITLSDRWKPFAMEKGAKGFARFCLSMTFLAVLPFLYFSCAFLSLAGITRQLVLDVSSVIELMTVCALVAPIYGFYCFWAGIVLLNREKLYADETWKLLLDRGSVEFLDQRRAGLSLVWGLAWIVLPVVAARIVL